MHVLLTGASSGIGEALAVAMGRRGWKLTLVARRQAELERVAARIGGENVRVLPGDMGKLDELEGLVQRAEAGLGPIDALVNNAGVEKVARTLDVSNDESERLMAVNLLAPLRLVKLVAPGMITRKSGTIVNVTSVAGLVPLPYATHYSASKAALSSASEHLRLELGDLGLNVLTVYPGPIVTAMGERAAASYSKDALPRALWGSADGLAEATISAMESRAARLIYPRMYTFLQWFPGFTRWAQFRLAPPPASR
jgi:short-subunit dehydrogenase